MTFVLFCYILLCEVEDGKFFKKNKYDCAQRHICTHCCVYTLRLEVYPYYGYKRVRRHITENQKEGGCHEKDNFWFIFALSEHC